MIFLMFEEFTIVASHEFVVSLGIGLLLVSVVVVVLFFGVIFQPWYGVVRAFGFSVSRCAFFGLRFASVVFILGFLAWRFVSVVLIFGLRVIVRHCCW